MLKMKRGNAVESLITCVLIQMTGNSGVIWLRWPWGMGPLSEQEQEQKITDII